MKNYPDSVNIFHSWCDVCYNFYDYEKWLNLESNEELPEVGYEVPYKLSFEPYFLGPFSNLMPLWLPFQPITGPVTRPTSFWKRPKLQTKCYHIMIADFEVMVITK